MNYEFDKIIDRRNTNSLKWQGIKDDLCMGIADMDFQVAPCIMEAIQKKVDTGIFGYSVISEEYFTSFQQWWKKRHAFFIKREWMLYSNGVLPAIASIIKKVTTPGEGICVLSPVYNLFYNTIRNHGRAVISSDLQYQNGIYTIDFDDLEEKLRNPQTTMMILCNPHNPIGRIWSREELAKIGALCWQYHVVIISDEIHCDITEVGKGYIPFASIDEHCKQCSITCLSASKAFNLAGLQFACLVVADEVLRHKVNRGLQNDEVGEPNIFACEAAIAAFQKGEQWLEEVRAYIDENKKTADRYIKEHLSQLRYVPCDATYLMWIDCQSLYPLVTQFCTFLQKEKHLVIASGDQFGKNGGNFIRMNIACPRKQLLTGLERLKEGVEEFYDKFIDIC